MFRFEHAIVRTPAPTFAAGLTTVITDAPPSLERMLEQHAAYVDALGRAGLRVDVLPALDVYPDAHFVEDVAVIVPELAIVTRPGAAARRGEAGHIVRALARRRRVARIEPPATVDGGDVLIVDRRVFVSRSARTNDAGVEALEALLGPIGYRITPVPVASGLHLKSGVSLVGPQLLVASSAFASRPELAGFEIIEVSAAESYAANLVRINDVILIAAGFSELAAALRERGLEPIALDMSEAEKMDGGLSCLSLRL